MARQFHFVVVTEIDDDGSASSWIDYATTEARFTDGEVWDTNAEEWLAVPNVDADTDALANDYATIADELTRVLPMLSRNEYGDIVNAPTRPTLVIDKMTGTVLSANTCYLIDAEELPEFYLSDSEIAAVADRVGVPVLATQRTRRAAP